MSVKYNTLARIGSAVALLVAAASSASAGLFDGNEKEACLSALSSEIQLCTNTLMKLNLAAADAKACYDELKKCHVSFLRIADGYDSISEEYLKIDAELDKADKNLQDPKVRGEYRPRLVGLYEKEKKLDEEFNDLQSQCVEAKVLKQKAEDAVRVFENLSALWEQQYNNVRKHRIKCGHDACAHRAAALSPMDTGVDGLNKELATVSMDGGEVFEDIVDKQLLLKYERMCCLLLVQKIASHFGFQDVKDLKALLAELEKQ